MPRAKVNSAEIYYEEAGSGPPIILSPGGLQGVMKRYRPMLADLSHEHRVIAYDRRFGGQSSSPMEVQTWDMACEDVIGLMDTLGIEQAYLGGGSFGAGISLGCALRYPDRVQAIFLSNLAGGLLCNVYLATKLYQSLEMALDRGIKAVVDAFNRDDRFGPFVPEQATYDPEYRKTLEAMAPADFAQVMRDTICALFDGPYLTLGMTREMLRAIQTPSLVIVTPGHDYLCPRGVAEQVHHLVPNSQWAEVPRYGEAPAQYIRCILQFLAEAEARGH